MPAYLGIDTSNYTTSAAHAAAALCGAGRLDLARERFLCLHFSGGTTDCLLVSPDSERVLRVQLLYTSLDLKAGQAVDRVGALLGLKFPAGPALSALAALGPLPVVFAGGVMCSSILRPPLEEKFGGIFAPPAYSSDNAAGAAVLAMLRHTGGAAE